MNLGKKDMLYEGRKNTRGETFRWRSYRILGLAILAVCLCACMIAFPLVSVHKRRIRALFQELTASASASASDLSSSTAATSSATELASAAATTASAAQKDFLEIATSTGTDKVEAYKQLPTCLNDNNKCVRGDAVRETCRPWGHFYDTLYNRWLGKYSSDDADPIQFLEIGYYQGKGFEAYSKFLPAAEKHSMEISCLPEGPLAEGKWPYANPAENHAMYKGLREAHRLHCGDASNYDFLHTTWTTEMKRADAPPLMVVVDDGSHQHKHMAASLFFWFPRIEPGGILVVEDIQPIPIANMFRTHIVPQVMKDIHWCGGSKSSVPDTVCFPTIQSLLQGVHCEMHICVFVRNNEPAYEPDRATSMTPSDAFTGAQKCLFG